MSGGAILYILRCADDSYYVGTTRGDLERRVAEHNAGAFGGYTSPRRPVTLLFSQHFSAITDAIAAERQIKGWSRAKKEAFVAGRFDRLRDLSRRALILRDARLRRAPQDDDESVPLHLGRLRDTITATHPSRRDPSDHSSG